MANKCFFHQPQVKPCAPQPWEATLWSWSSCAGHQLEPWWACRSSHQRWATSSDGRGAARSQSGSQIAGCQNPNPGSFAAPRSACTGFTIWPFNPQFSPFRAQKNQSGPLKGLNRHLKGCLIHSLGTGSWYDWQPNARRTSRSFPHTWHWTAPWKKTSQSRTCSSQGVTADSINAL